MRFSLEHMFAAQVVILMIVSNAIRSVPGASAGAATAAAADATDLRSVGSVATGRAEVAASTPAGGRALSRASLDQVMEALVQLEALLGNELQQ